MFAETAPEFGALGFSNHGPMATEVLVTLGLEDAVERWTANYRTRLQSAPPAAPPLRDDEWPAALGQAAQYAGWLALFERELADRPPRAVVGEWVPRLAPGAVAAAGHGLIRTAHGLRALSRDDTPARRVELAHGLAYWASTYQELPGPPLLIGHQRVGEALAALPYLPEETPDEILISDQVAHMADIADEFEQAVASLAPAGSAVEVLDALAVGGAHAYLRNAEHGSVIALIHAVTTPMALELMLPWLAPEDHDAALAYAWQAVASLHVAYDVDRRDPQDRGPDPAAPSTEEAVARAVASGDEHALKITEAALRCHARTGDPALLHMAADAAARLRA